MRRQVIEQTRALYMSSNPVFLAMQTCSSRCFERLCCDALQPFWVVPQEQLFSFGECCNSMYFVSGGKLNYVKYSPVLQSLARNGTVAFSSKARTKSSADLVATTNEHACQKGRSLCEPVLWTHWVHCGDCIAHSHTSMFKLRSSDFQALVSAYTIVNSIVRKHAALFVRTLNAQDRTQRTDLFDSMRMLEEDERMNPAKQMKRAKRTAQSPTAAPRHNF